MSKVGVDGGAVTSAASKVASGQQEIPSASARQSISGNAAGGPSQTFHSAFQTRVDQLSAKVEALQVQVGQSIDALNKATSMLHGANESAREQVSTILASLDPGTTTSTTASQTSTGAGSGQRPSGSLQ